MDVLVKLSIPNCIYQFYQQASAHVANSSPEDIMSDALTAYAGLLSEDVAKKLRSASDGSCEISKSI